MLAYQTQVQNMQLIDEFDVDFESKNSISLNLMFKGKRGSRLLRDDKFRLPSQLCTKRKKSLRDSFQREATQTSV